MTANTLLADGWHPGHDPDTCRRCGAQMGNGIAMQQTYTCGSPDFGECVTFSPGGPGRLIECRKCPACGWSVGNG